MQYLSTDDPLAVAAVAAIRSGDVEALKRLLAENAFLATARLGEVSCDSHSKSRTLLHVVTDWPGHYPNGAESVAVLVAAGADVNAPIAGRHTERRCTGPQAVTCVAVLDALLDHGANIEAPGAVIGGGTPIADAAAFGQWKAAQRLVERGAKTSLWEAAALGLLDRVQKHFADNTLPPWQFGPAHPGGTEPDEVTHAFWCACHGGQKEVAEYLLNRGADINWIGYDKLTPLGVPEPMPWSHG